MLATVNRISFDRICQLPECQMPLRGKCRAMTCCPGTTEGVRRILLAMVGFRPGAGKTGIVAASFVSMVVSFHTQASTIGQNTDQETTQNHKFRRTINRPWMRDIRGSASNRVWLRGLPKRSSTKQADSMQRYCRLAAGQPVDRYLA